MHTVEEIRAEYDRLDRICGVDTSGIEIVISRRSVNRLGSFRYSAPESGRPLRIMISASILEEEKQFWDTVRHEYAHAAVYLLYPGEKHGHDDVWKAVCRKIGCSPKSHARESTKRKEMREERSKYIVSCPGCGSEFYYLRAGTVVQMMRRGQGYRLRCPKCGGNSLRLMEKR